MAIVKGNLHSPFICLSGVAVCSFRFGCNSPDLDISVNKLTPHWSSNIGFGLNGVNLLALMVFYRVFSTMLKQGQFLD